jgi:hypothetical protein
MLRAEGRHLDGRPRRTDLVVAGVPGDAGIGGSVAADPVTERDLRVAEIEELVFVLRAFAGLESPFPVAAVPAPVVSVAVPHLVNLCQREVRLAVEPLHGSEERRDARTILPLEASKAETAPRVLVVEEIDESVRGVGFFLSVGQPSGRGEIGAHALGEVTGGAR